MGYRIREVKKDLYLRVKNKTTMNLCGPLEDLNDPEKPLRMATRGIMVPVWFSYGGNVRRHLEQLINRKLTRFASDHWSGGEIM